MSEAQERQAALERIEQLKDRVAQLEADKEQLREALEEAVDEASDGIVDPGIVSTWRDLLEELAG